MKAMRDISSELEYKGKKYRLVFNLNVMQEIQSEYHSLDEWGALTDGSQGEPDAKAVIFGFTAMLNEGIDMENEENGTDTKLLTAKQVGRILSDVGMAQAVSKMSDTVVESTKSGDERKNESSPTK